VASQHQICRVTLENETGIINVVLWNELIQKQRREALGARLLTVYGGWQSESGVRHVIAKRLADHSHLLGNLMVASRGFSLVSPLICWTLSKKNLVQTLITDLNRIDAAEMVRP
jgi:DNA polymerase III alpha subunit